MRNEYDRDDAHASTKLTYLLAGGVIGAVVALLFAPKAGVELREDIADATRILQSRSPLSVRRADWDCSAETSLVSRMAAVYLTTLLTLC
jgi:hypothetical protein